MVKTCYGLCSLRTGIRIIASYELISTILFFLSAFVFEMYSKIHPFYDDVNVYYFLQSCIIIITILKLFSSCSLMQATFQNAPYKIFLWIVVTCIINLTAFIVSIKLYIHKVYIAFSKHAVIVKATEPNPLEYYLLLAFIIIVNFISIIEIHIVTSFYKKEKHIEEVEQYTRVQNTNSHHTSNIFNGDYARSSIIRPEDQTSIFTSFKAVPV